MVFIFWSKPLFNEVNDLRAEKEAIESALANSRQLQSLLDENLYKYNSISEEDLARLNKIFGGQEESVELILEVGKLAEANDITLKRINVQNKSASNIPLSQTPSLRSIPIDMMFAGSYQSFISFLESLERSLKIIDISRLEFSAAGDGKSYDFILGGFVYGQFK